MKQILSVLGGIAFTFAWWWMLGKFFEIIFWGWQG
jgi:hypothetical protein